MLTSSDKRTDENAIESVREADRARGFGPITFSIRTLELASLGYLAIPIAIFLIGYLKPQPKRKSILYRLPICEEAKHHNQLSNLPKFAGKMAPPCATVGTP